MHASFGVGEITHTFGSGEKVSIAVKFAGMGPKILIPAWPRLSLWVPDSVELPVISRIYSAPCRMLPAFVG